MDNKKYYVLHDRNMVVRNSGEQLSEEDFNTISSACTPIDIFTEEANGIVAMDMGANATLPYGYMTVPIRQTFAEMTDSAFLLSRAKALLEWRQRTKYCGCCGSKLDEHSTLTARVCPNCGNLIFPRIEPCIITVVSRGDKILLARHVQRNQQIYACIAGFMEAGETAEEAVAREVMEETGIKVRNIRYFGSQSWPFPSQLMLGFTAEYESGELKLQEDEIADAQWFSRDDCPASPPPGSIAWRLIHES